jgi:hypothetical protein
MINLFRAIFHQDFFEHQSKGMSESVIYHQFIHPANAIQATQVLRVQFCVVFEIARYTLYHHVCSNLYYRKSVHCRNSNRELPILHSFIIIIIIIIILQWFSGVVQQQREAGKASEANIEAELFAKFSLFTNTD